MLCVCVRCHVTFYRTNSQIKHGGGKYCSRTCQDKHKHDRVSERFWSKVIKGSKEECWPWICGRNSGYGAFWYKGNNVPASRMAFILAFGEIDATLNVCHSCDNPPCCNPNHLFLGTDYDNVQDKIKKGRLRVLRGQEMWASKLTEEDVQAIRQRYQPWKVTATQLSMEYGVSPFCIRNIIAGHSWKWLDTQGR